MVFFILYLICIFSILAYALSPKRESWKERMFHLGILGAGFLLQYFWPWTGRIIIMLWGGLCWAGIRAGDT